MKKIFSLTLLLAAPLWLAAQCTDLSAPFVICTGSQNIPIMDVPTGPEALIFATDLAIDVTDDCSAPEEITITISRDFPIPAVTPQVLFFNCDDEGLRIPVAVIATDATGKWDYCLTEIYVEDPMGLCPSGTFINATTGVPYPSGQSALLLANDGDEISILAEEKLGNFTSPDNITVSLTSPEGATLPITNLAIGTDGTLKTTGDFIFTMENVSGSTDGKGAWEVANTGGAEAGSINLLGLEIEVYTQLSVSENILGGEPNAQINLSVAGGTLALSDGILAPIGPLSESESPTTLYTAALINGETPTAEVGIAGSVEEVFGAAANSPQARSLTLTPGLASPYYVNNTWRIGFLSETGTPQSTLYEVELNFPTSLQTGMAVMDIPVVAIRKNGQVNYAFGTPHPGKLLTSGGAISDPVYNTISFTGSGMGGEVAIFGCPSCGTDKVLICQVPPGNPANARTKCISKASLFAHLDNGSYCGPCLEANTPDAMARPFSTRPDNNSLRVFPNPVKGRLYLAFGEEADSPRHLRLFNLNGRILREQVVGAGRASVEFNLDGLPAGIYMLQVQDEEGSQWVKVAVE
ncbi:MAG: T9SS type A sorting domain-containing protein [Lewinellaceae bacterium]|nr:T9SS type A sorting domain-containing protein [Lewinellaceae bacterium]MCB9286242.1 T9SS type A sorting domain-containing protein [Lewinellaceae bacterium]